jgi:hypothetical protein
MMMVAEASLTRRRFRLLSSLSGGKKSAHLRRDCASQCPASPRNPVLPPQFPRRSHVWPLAVQSLQVIPRLPHVVSLLFMQVPPWQQPLRQLPRLQPRPPPPDEPDELPEELPLEDPLDDPLDELLVGSPQVPAWHTWFTPVQSLQVEPWVPQAESSIPELQDPFMSQHPVVHVAAQALAALPPSPPALEEASSPEELPLSSPEGIFRPGPVDVGIGGAASAAGPASCVGVTTGMSRRESSVLPVPPVAQATRMTRTTEPNPRVLGPDEPMRKTSGPAAVAPVNHRRLGHQGRRGITLHDYAHAIPFCPHSL